MGSAGAPPLGLELDRTPPPPSCAEDAGSPPLGCPPPAPLGLAVPPPAVALTARRLALNVPRVSPGYTNNNNDDDHVDDADITGKGRQFSPKPNKSSRATPPLIVSSESEILGSVNDFILKRFFSVEACRHLEMPPPRQGFGLR